MAGLEVRVDASELTKLVADIKKEADPKPRLRELRAGLKAAAKPFVPALKAAIGRIPSKGLLPTPAARSKRRGGTLRSVMQKAVTIKFRASGRSAGVGVFMDPGKMPDGMKSLPAYFERKPGYERLRHPTYGNIEVWQQQAVPAAGYFTHTVQPLAFKAQREAKKVLDETADRIAKG